MKVHFSGDSCHNWASGCCAGTCKQTNSEKKLKKMNTTSKNEHNIPLFESYNSLCSNIASWNEAMKT